VAETAVGAVLMVVLSQPLELRKLGVWLFVCAKIRYYGYPFKSTKNGSTASSGAAGDA